MARGKTCLKSAPRVVSTIKSDRCGLRRWSSRLFRNIATGEWNSLRAVSAVLLPVLLLLLLTLLEAADELL